MNDIYMYYMYVGIIAKSIGNATHKVMFCVFFGYLGIDQVLKNQKFPKMQIYPNQECLCVCVCFFFFFFFWGGGGGRRGGVVAPWYMYVCVCM